MSYKLILIPEGSVLPEDVAHMHVKGVDTLKKILAGDEKRVIVDINVRELQLIVEYRDLFDIDVEAVIGLQGAMYSTVWNTYISTMDRLTVDNLRAQLQEENAGRAKAGSARANDPGARERFQRAAPRRAEELMAPTTETPPDESEFDQ